MTAGFAGARVLEDGLSIHVFDIPITFVVDDRTDQPVDPGAYRIRAVTHGAYSPSIAGSIGLVGVPHERGQFGVEARRIRQCSECKRIFWAGRMDKFACTKKCVQRRRVRLWRERYPETYKLQRIRNANAVVSTTVKSDNKRRRKS